MNRNILRQVARMNGVSVAEVRREIGIAIAAAYENPTAAALAIPRKGEVPTPEEFIGHCADKVLRDGNNLS